MSLNPADFAMLEQMLLQLTLPDTTAIQAAEKQLKEYVKKPESVSALFQLLQGSDKPQVRQLAAVLLRRKILSHWSRLPQEARTAIQAGLLGTITNDPFHLARKGAANVVAALAKTTLLTGEWPELMQFCLQCTQSPNPDHREVAMTLFTSMMENLGDKLRQNFAQLCELVHIALKDAELKVRVAALRAMGAATNLLAEDEDVVVFKALLPPLLDTIKQCLASADEDTPIIAFEILDELIESPIPVLRGQVPTLLHFMLEISGNKEVSLNVREKAMNFVQVVYSHCL